MSRVNGYGGPPVGTPRQAPRRIHFQPKPDITPYEVALCMSVMFNLVGWKPGNGDPAILITELDEGARRHFEISGVLLGT